MVRRKPGFMNQLEKRIQRRLGNIKPKSEPRPPSNVTMPEDLSIIIPSPADLVKKIVIGGRNANARDQPK